MKILNITEIQEEVHANAKAKGFWEEGRHRDKGKMVILIVSELVECMEADREDRLVLSKNFDFFEGLFHKDIFSEKSLTMIPFFEREIKNTLEDEIADAAIRILDYTKGWDLPLYEREYRKDTTGDIANDLLRIINYVLSAHNNVSGKDWGYCIAAIEAFCSWHNIDINQHIAWKVAYNKTRGYKHGKKY